jgi:uncharacterized protein (TIGR02246 family)
MRNSRLLVVVVLVVTSLFVAAVRTNGANKDEQEIRALDDHFAAAFRAKDVDTIMKSYAPGAELFVFDVTPPRQHIGFDDYKKDWQDFFAAFPGPVDKFEVEDLNIVADGKLAYSHSVQAGTVTAKDGSKFSLTVRVTDCYRKINGKWLITQEHVSVPVDMETGKGDWASKP